MVVLFTETRCVTFYHLELGNVGEENKFKVFGIIWGSRTEASYVCVYELLLRLKRRICSVGSQITLGLKIVFNFFARGGPSHSCWVGIMVIVNGSRARRNLLFMAWDRIWSTHFWSTSFHLTWHHRQSNFDVPPWNENLSFVVAQTKFFNNSASTIAVCKAWAACVRRGQGMTQRPLPSEWEQRRPAHPHQQRWARKAVGEREHRHEGLQRSHRVHHHDTQQQVRSDDILGHFTNAIIQHRKRRQSHNQLE